MLDFDKIFKMVQLNDYSELNQLVGYKFSLEDYQRLYQYLGQQSNVEIKFIVFSLFNSKLRGSIAQQFAFTINKIDINYELNDAIIQVLGKFIFRLNKLSGQSLSVQNTDIMLSALSNQKKISLDYLSLCIPPNTIFKVQVLNKIILSNEIINLEEITESVINALPQSKDILDTIFSRKINIAKLSKLALKLPIIYRLKQLQNIFDTQFLISQPEKVQKLFIMLKDQLIDTFLQFQLELSVDFYQFFGQIYNIFCNVKIDWLVQISFQFLQQTEFAFQISEQSQFFWQGLFDYCQNDQIISYIEQKGQQLELCQRIQFFANLFSYNHKFYFVTQCCIEVLQSNCDIQYKFFASYQLFQMTELINPQFLPTVLNTFLYFQTHLQSNQQLIFEINMLEYYDYTLATLSGAINQLSKTLVAQQFTDIMVITQITNLLFFTPHTALFNLFLHIKVANQLESVLSKLSAQQLVLAYIVLETIQIDQETEIIYNQPEFCVLDEFQVTYIISFLASFQFNPKLQEFVLQLISFDIQNQFLKDLVLENVQELLPSLVYDLSGEIVLENIQKVIQFCLKNEIQEDLLRLISEIYNLKDDNIQVQSMSFILFTEQILGYIQSILLTESPMVRVAFTLLNVYLENQMDLDQFLVELLVDFIENGNKETRKNSFEVSNTLSYLGNSQVQQIIQEVMIQLSGSIQEQHIGLINAIMQITDDKFERQTELRLVLDQLKKLLQ